MIRPVRKIASDECNFRTPAYFYESARMGMQDFLENGPTPDHSDVLLPAFIGWSSREGSGVFDPVRRSGRRAVFYDLNPDLTVDLKLLEEQMSARRFHVVVLIHYFGRTDPNLEAVRRLCDDHGAILVEDLAHGFLSWAGSGAGLRGQIQMFSLHKLFPLEMGGSVVYADRSLVHLQESTEPNLASRLLSFDWAGISLARRRNFQHLASQLQELPEHGVLFDLLWSELADSDVPQTLPVRIRADNRDRIYFHLNEGGIGAVSLYHTLIKEVHAEFPRMMSLSDHILNLPVHQDVEVDDIDDVVAVFKASLHG